MRVAVDARALSAHPTGVGRYLEGLLGAWLDLYPEDSFLLLSPRQIRLPAALRGRVEARTTAGRVPGTIWLQTLAPFVAERGGSHLFFGPLGILPLRSSVPGVATIHDLTPVLRPEWHSLKNRLGFTLLGPTVERASALVAVSEATRRDLVKAYPGCEAKCVVIPNGLSPLSAEAPANQPEGGRPYVLYLGTLEPRKNLTRLVEAMESLWDRLPDFPDLVLAGGSGWGLRGFAERLHASRHAGRIRRIGYVPPEKTAPLLRGARLLAYPSLYEGFGMPPLEAMSVGTPVVGSSASSLPEVIGDAGLLPNPESVAEIAAALQKAEGDEAWRAEARTRGLARSALFTWTAAAERTRRVFEAAIA